MSETVWREKPYGQGTYMRSRKPKRVSQIHICESRIAEAAITRCGRRMEPRTAGTRLVYGTASEDPQVELIGPFCLKCFPARGDSK